MALETTSAELPRLRIAVDIGGTFTDLAAFDETSGELLLRQGAVDPRPAGQRHPEHPGRRRHRPHATALFLHGSTIAINTLLERSGAQTALLITEGFRDIYEIGRVNRPDAYNLFFGKHVPLVRALLRFEVQRAPARRRQRAQAAGRGPPARTSCARSRRRASRPWRSCCCTPTATRRTSSASRRSCRKNCPAVFVTASHELSQEYREFERVSTAVAQCLCRAARRRPTSANCETHLDEKGFDGDFYRRCSRPAALFPVEHARRDCVRMLESGPGRRRDRRAGDLRATGPERCDRLRHGRHDREGRRDQRGQAAHDRQRADRRLRAGVADPDPDDGHLRGRHRRRQHRAHRARATRCASGRKAPARCPARSVTAAAAPNPR